MKTLYKIDIQTLPNCNTTMSRVLLANKEASYHVVSFIKLANSLIYEMDEYWADDGEVPAWRKEMGIGKAIR